MKKIKYVLLIVMLIVAIMVTCVACKNNEKEQGEYTIVAPDGATALALASFIKDNTFDYGTITPSIVDATLIATEAIKSDFAIVPANLAAKLYNSNAGYKAIAAVTNGNLFMVSSTENTSFEMSDLKGKMLYVIGQGAVPSMITLGLLDKANISYQVSESIVDENTVSIHYCSNGTEVIQKLVQAKNSSTTIYGVLAEPAVTTVVNTSKGYQVADIQELWKTATNSDVYGFAQAVLIAKDSICENTELVDAVLAKLATNETYVVENPAEAREKIASIYSTTALPETLTATVVTRCNVKTYKASTYAQYIKNTLDAAYAVASASVGGSVPALDSGFYC